VVNSKAKGNRGELEACKALLEIGIHARRSQQYHGFADYGDIYISGAPQLHTEVKNLQRISVFAFYEQAVRDSRGKRIPWCLLHANRKPWLALVAVNDLFRLANQLEVARFHASSKPEAETP